MSKTKTIRSFLLGVCASLLAAAISYGIAMFVSWQHMCHLEGYWFQEIPGLTERPYSIGQFTYNKFNRTFSWDGTNYTVEGKPAAYWQSFYLRPDVKNREILYIFGGKEKSRFDGFGVMDLRDVGGKGLVPIGGYFQDARKEASPRQDFEMTRLQDITDKIGMAQDNRTLEDFHRRIVKEYHEYKDTERAN